MSISKNLHKIRSDVGQDIEIIAVSKKQPANRILEALDAGQKIYGENRVQDAFKIWPDLKKTYPDTKLHLIGPLQSNKTADAVALFDVIQTLDRKKIIDACAGEEQRQGRTLEYYIQVNTGEEDQKSGILPRDLKDLYEYGRKLGLNITGLMCIPPIDEAPSLHFALLRKLTNQLGLKKLSMGMSGDYMTAVKFGTTSVRIGTAIFGIRP